MWPMEMHTTKISMQHFHATMNNEIILSKPKTLQMHYCNIMQIRSSPIYILQLLDEYNPEVNEMQ